MQILNNTHFFQSVPPYWYQAREPSHFCDLVTLQTVTYPNFEILSFQGGSRILLESFVSSAFGLRQLTHDIPTRDLEFPYHMTMVAC
jgi:hypothetical protein